LDIKVLYHSRTGNTKKVADAIAHSLNQAAEKIPPVYPLENIKLLFLGCGVYMGKIDNKVKEFVAGLDGSKVRSIALFGTCGEQDTAAQIQTIKDLLEGKGINIINESYVCKGRTFIFFNREHPSREDLKSAQDFVRRVVEKIRD